MPPNTEKPDCWLNAFAKNYFSQFGEDGILERIFEVIPDIDRWCVEFGAWDGKHLSNTCNRILSHGYAAVLFESHPRRFQELQSNYAQSPRTITFRQAVGFGPEDNLDRLLEQTQIPWTFDLLSIDIDGNDYHVWDAVQKYRPKVVVIEFNPTVSDSLEFVQEKNINVMHGSSLLALVRLGRRKQYELVATTFCNALFVDSCYFPLFGIRDNSIGQLRSDNSAVSYLFYGFDGTVMLRGSRNMLWHGLPLDERMMQVLPQHLRQYPDNYND